MDSFPGSVIRPFLRSGRRNAFRVLPEVLIGELMLRPMSRVCSCGADHQTLEPVTLDRKVFFVFQAGSSGWGSVRLRVIQMVRNLKAAVSNPHLVRVVTEEKLRRLAPRDADIVFSKFSVREGNLAWMESLTEERNRVYVDLVDGWGIPGLEKVVSSFICASRSEYEFRTKGGLDAFYIPHQVDHRWPSADFTARKFGVAYLGAPGGALFLDELNLETKLFTGLFLQDSQIPQIVEALAPASHHYSVRVFFGEGNFKDATKAYVSARFGAVFIGSQADEESLLVLGRDYPYLASSSSIEDVDKVLRYAEETFLGPVWIEAVDTMKSLRSEICDLFNGQLLANCLSGSGPNDFWQSTRA